MWSREIPNASYFVEAISDPLTGERVSGVSREVSLSKPNQGTFTLVASGLQLAAFSISLRAYSTDGSAQPEVLLKGIAAPGSSSIFEIQYDSSPGATAQVGRVASFQSTLSDISNGLKIGLIDNQGIANSLSQKIHAAAKASKQRRSNILNAFKNEIHAQAGKHISGIAVQMLLGDADSLLGQSQ